MENNRYNTVETRSEILDVKFKRKITEELEGKDLIKFYVKHFYMFLRKETRMFIILEIQDYIKLRAGHYKFNLEDYTAKPDVEAEFKKIANTINRSLPNPSSMFSMILEYLDLIVPNNVELSRRIIFEIDKLMFQVTKFTQLYYNGDGRGSIIYINLYDRAK
jgi:hypothetical protein